MDQRLIARVFSFRYASRVSLESEELKIRRQERDAPGHLERVLEELSRREVINTGVIATRTCASIPSRSTASSRDPRSRVPRVARRVLIVVGLAVLAGALAWRSPAGR